MKSKIWLIISVLFFSVLVLGLAEARTYGTGAYGTGGYGNDTTAPTISSFSCSPTSVYTGDTITCSCSATDDTGISPTVSYTTNPSTSSSGTLTTTCTATDSNNNSVSSSVTYSVSQRGSGESSPAAEVKQSHIWTSVSSGSKLTLDLTNKAIGVDAVEFTTSTDLSNVKLTVTKLDSKPASVDAPTNSVFRYLEIAKENLNNTDLSSAKITFKVDKSWLTNNSLSEDNVVLLRYTDKWDELETTKKTSDSTTVAYEAKTPGFSYFAVSTKSAAAEPIEEPEQPAENETQEQPIEEPEQPEQPPAEEPKPTAPVDSTVWIVVGIIVVIIIIILAVVAVRRK